MSTKKSLIEKYDISISHLDFAYIEKCSNSREMEKIVTILRSGEEGFYPDLTKKAEEKLAELNPNSKCLRTEEPLLTKYSISKEEWSVENGPILDWSSDAKEVDKQLNEMGTDTEIFKKTTEVRTKKIVLGKPTQKEAQSNTRSENRIKSTDYSAWDKFDADTEILKMDLQEEKIKEEIERKNRKNLESSKIETINERSFNNLSVLEKEKLSTVYKEKGNDYFRSKEYEEALKEYSTSIEIYPTAAGYNNRAITNIKLKKFENSLSDCKLCLELEPKNIKALFRKAESFLGLNRNIDALDTYYEIMEIEPTNVHAVKAYNDLSLKSPTNRRASGTRIQISEDKVDPKVTPKINRNKVTPKKNINEDYSELIKPDKIIKNNFYSAMENITKKSNLDASKVDLKETSESQYFEDAIEDQTSSRVLIEEI